IALCQSNEKAGLMIRKELFGKLSDGREAYLFTLKNEAGMTVTLTDYGASIVSVKVPDRDGKLADVALGYDSLAGYVNGTVYFGGIVGRYANRIAGGKFTLDGKTYQVTVNDGQNCLHGGKIGFNKVLWTAEPAESPEGSSVRFTYASKDGEEGFPGTVTVTATYTLTKDNAIRIDFTGTTDKTTILNMCNHSYFNLTGDPTKTILDHELMINADKFTPVDSNLIPTGELASVVNTPFDFLKPTRIGARINDNNDQLKKCRGYDLNWVLNDYTKKIRLAAELYDPSSGRVMDVLTDQPGIQFYTGNFLNGSEVGKNGVRYQYRTGLALETQLYPDSPNKPGFPSPTLKPGETYRTTTIYKFSVKK
ncbi:MAG TPA: aldose epimerase family protein, partial [Candidatus Acidoferrales bacterium]|nr:aldose epimerase family protein [Candidatus Acidoferrales bacterium]